MHITLYVLTILSSSVVLHHQYLTPASNTQIFHLLPDDSDQLLRVFARRLFPSKLTNLMNPCRWLERCLTCTKEVFVTVTCTRTMCSWTPRRGRRSCAISARASFTTPRSMSRTAPLSRGLRLGLSVCWPETWRAGARDANGFYR